MTNCCSHRAIPYSDCLNTRCCKGPSQTLLFHWCWNCFFLLVFLGLFFGSFLLEVLVQNDFFFLSSVRLEWLIPPLWKRQDEYSFKTNKKTPQPNRKTHTYFLEAIQACYQNERLNGNDIKLRYTEYVSESERNSCVCVKMQVLKT